MIIKSKRKLLAATSSLALLFAGVGSVLLFARADTVNTAVSPDSLWESVKYSSVGMGDVPEYWYNDLAYGLESNLLARRGVKIDNYGANAKVVYKNTIDVSSLTRDDVFVQIVPLSENRGSADFKEINIRMTDAEDPTNYVTINMHQSIWWQTTTFYQVGTSEIENGGLRWGFYREEGDEWDSVVEGGLSGTETINGAFIGYYCQDADGTVIEDMGTACPFTLSYDYKEKIFYCYVPTTDESTGTTGLTRKTIRDLDDPLQVGYGNEWGGFTSGRVNVQIEVSDFTASQASYIITQFNGVNFGDEYVSDSEKPSMTTQADEDPSILTAVVGKEYPLFDAVADDSVYGSINDIKKYLVEPQSEEPVLIQGDSFTPTVTGNHKLIYSAIDGAGNENRKEYVLSVVMVADPIKITTLQSVADTVKVGEVVTIPEISVTGGVGKIEKSVRIYRLNGNDDTSENVSSFTPTLAGTYVIEYGVTDYLGITAKKTYYFNAERSKSPICEFPYVPNVMVSGKTVKLSEMSSLDYSANGAGAGAVVNIYASRQTGVKGEKIDYLYTPELAANETEATFYITYETYCKGYENEASTKVYPVKVIKVTQLYDLFDRSDIDVTPNEEYLDFSTQAEGANMRYVNPLAAKNFEILFDIPVTENNFNTLKLKFTDSLNPSQYITVDIVRNNGAKRCFVYVNGELCEMSGAFNGESNSPFHITFKTLTNQLIDHEGRIITTLKRYADGSEYTGFDSGRVYVDFEFKGVTGKSTVRLEKLGNQAMYAEYDYNGNLIDVSDYTSPIITVSDTIIAKATKYTRVHIPSAQAFDAIDPHVKCYVTITLNGKKVIDRVAAEDGFDFYVNEYGKYVISYQAEDSSYNDVRQFFTLNVRDDEAPTLTVLGDIAGNISIGGKIVLPSAVALDRQGNTTLRVFVITPTGKMINVDGKTEYKPERRGVYTVRYYAYDETYNSTMVDYTVKVN